MKKNLRVISILLMFVLIFTACSGNTDNKTETVTKETETGTEASTSDTKEEASNQNLPDTWEGSYPETVKFEIGLGINTADVFAEGETFDNNQYTRFIKDTLNVEVTQAWQAQAGPDYGSKVNLSIASNDMPDALVVDDTQFRAMAEAGMLADLSDAFEKFASDTMKIAFDKTNGLAMENVMIDGKMLALPNIPVPDDGYTPVWIRKDWLDQLNLEVPKTAEELKTVAKAFIDNDMSGTGETIGMVGPDNGGALYSTFLSSSNSMYGFDPIFSSLDAYPGYWIDGPDGKAAYGSILPETKNALAFLAKMYSDGIIDAQMAVRKDTTELVVSGKTGVYCGPWWTGYWPLPDAWANNLEANWQCYMLENASGVINTHMSSISAQYLVVRKDYEHPEVAIILNDLLIKHEGNFDTSLSGINYFPARVVIAAYDELSFTRDAIFNVLNGSKTVADYETDFSTYKLLSADLNGISKVKLEPFDQFDIQTWNREASPGDHNRLYSIMVGVGSYSGKEMNKVYSKIYGQTKTMELKWANLKKMEDETFLKIIMGVEPIDAFDKFVTDWKAQGGDEITQEVIKQGE